MISESSTRSSLSGSAAAIVAMAALLMAAPTRAEDPLLGQIKVIKCVGCDPGAVNLVVHDPIDVRDFEVQIKEADYQKIVTPLAGQTVYDKEGCFYWMEQPKGLKPAAGKDKAKEADKKGGKKTLKKEVGTGKDSSQPGGGEGASVTASQEPEGIPSRCVPYVRLEPKPARPGDKKGEE